MNKNFALATIAAAVVLMVMGYLLYGVALMGFFESNATADVMKEAPEWLWLILGQLVTGVVLVLVLTWSGSTDVASGAKTGGLFGFLWSLGYGLTMYATANLMNLTGTLVDPIVAAVMFCVAGAVAGMLLGKGAAAA